MSSLGHSHALLHARCVVCREAIEEPAWNLSSVRIEAPNYGHYRHYAHPKCWETAPKETWTQRCFGCGYDSPGELLPPDWVLVYKQGDNTSVAEIRCPDCFSKKSPDPRRVRYVTSK